MKRPELYRKTVDILYDAYFNDTLEHFNCYACAIGNLVAANNGFSFVPCIDREAYCYPAQTIVWDICKGKYAADIPNWFNGDKNGNKQLETTGYTIKEAWTIEKAFERAAKGTNKESHMFNGLVEVLEALKQIHEVEDNDIEVGRFKTHYQNKLAKV